VDDDQNAEEKQPQGKDSDQLNPAHDPPDVSAPLKKRAE
jgi:hypothetical protein